MYSSRRSQQRAREQVVRKFHVTYIADRVNPAVAGGSSRALSHLHSRRADDPASHLQDGATRVLAPARGPDTISLCPFYGEIMERASEHHRRDAGQPLLRQGRTVDAADRSPRSAGHESSTRASGRAASNDVTSDVLRGRPREERREGRRREEAANILQSRRARAERARLCE